MRPWEAPRIFGGWVFCEHGCGFLEYDRFLYNVEEYLMISEQERKMMASDGLLKKPGTRSHYLKPEAPWLACGSWLLPLVSWYLSDMCDPFA